LSTADSLIERWAPTDARDARAGDVREWLATHGLPSSRDEAWRYTDLDAISAALDQAGPPPPGRRAVTPAEVDQIAGHHGGPRLVFVNGTFDGDASDRELPPGVQLDEGERRSFEVEPADGFDALNELARTRTVSLLVGPAAHIAVPVHIVHLAAPDDASIALHPRVLVHAGRGSRAEIIETFAGLGGTTVTNASTRIVADAAADVTYHRVQVEHGDSTHVGTTRIDQAAGSTVRATTVTTGASVARSALDVHLTGPGASVDLRGLYLPAGHQRHDTVVTVDHAAPHCTSTQLFKGVVSDHGRGSYTGHVVVRPGAAGTDASQTNRNLLLQSTAQADTRPWLEICADDVRCSHGATVGRLDDDALFYLRSRGIPLAESRALLVAAFIGEILNTIRPVSLRDHLTAAVTVGTDGPRP
jgi:Fe-S cluster assembly protein SufD